MSCLFKPFCIMCLYTFFCFNLFCVFLKSIRHLISLCRRSFTGVSRWKKYVTLDFKLVTIIILLHHILIHCIFCVWKFKYVKNIQLRNVRIKLSVGTKYYQIKYLLRYANRNCVTIIFIQQLAKNYESQYLSPVASFSFGRRMW